MRPGGWRLPAIHFPYHISETRLTLHVCSGWPGRAQYTQYLKPNQYNFTSSMLKAYLGARSPSSSAFMISKIHYSWKKKPRGRQLNAKVCGSRSAFSRTFFLAQTTVFNNAISKASYVYTHSHFSTNLMHASVTNRSFTRPFWYHQAEIWGLSDKKKSVKVRP